MSEDQKPLHILELKAENVKRLRAVSIRPSGDVVVLGGRNAQGKSSVLDAIEMALGGGKSIPVEPVRRGARKARIVADLGEFTVERTITAKGPELVVRGKDGVARSSPQKLLDSLCARVTFDPLEFSRMEPDKQDALLKKLAGLDCSDLDRARAKVFDQRTDVNREAKRTAALLESHAEYFDGVPDAPVAVADVTARMQALTDRHLARGRILSRLESQRRELAKFEHEIERLREVARRAQEAVVEAEAHREQLSGAIAAAEAEVPAEPESIESLREELDELEETNKKIRSNQARRALEQELRKHEAAADGLTDTIASLDEEKADRLAKAKFPIAGLGFDESGPTLNRVPLGQASGAEKLRVSVAIGAALNPRVKVMLVRDGSLLDEDSMRLLAELARETESQVWIERVGTKDPSAIVIEDGEVMEAPVDGRMVGAERGAEAE